MKKIYMIFTLSLLAIYSIFAEQEVISSAPSFINDISISTEDQSTTIIAYASAQDFVTQLYYNNTPIDDGTTISQTAGNEDLFLTNSWELSPFSIRITGTNFDDFNLNIELEVGFFQLLDSNGNIALGNNSYIIDTQAMKIEDTTNIEGVTFSNFPSGSNLYTYNIPLSQAIYYASTDTANFKLTWDALNVDQPGNYISNIQVTFSIN